LFRGENNSYTRRRGEPECPYPVVGITSVEHAATVRRRLYQLLEKFTAFSG